MLANSVPGAFEPLLSPKKFAAELKVEFITPPRKLLDIVTLGALSGDFLINVMCSSVIFPLSTPFIFNFVCVEKFVDPFLHLTISTCLGSLILSVKYIIPSSMLAPVIIEVEENFNALDVALIQTKTGCTSFVSSLYSAIASIVVPAMNQ